MASIPDQQANVARGGRVIEQQSSSSVDAASAVVSAWSGWVGSRVVIRRRLPDGSATDVLGDLLSADAGGAVVATRRGQVEVAAAEVIVGKQVPPASRRSPPAHRSLDRWALQQVMTDGWAGLSTANLGQWRLREAAGFTSRANSALPVGDPGMPLPQAIEAVQHWYTGRNLPAVIAIPMELAPRSNPEPLDELLRQKGWTLKTPTLVMTAPTRVAFDSSRPHRTPGPTVRLSATPDADWLAVYKYRGSDLPEAAVPVLLSAPEVCFAAVPGGTTDAAAKAVGRGAIAHGWAGLAAMEVSADHRRQGLAQAVLHALAGWALERDAAAMYLQVSQDNEPALALYRATGFTPHHRYHYRVAPIPT